MTRAAAGATFCDFLEQLPRAGSVCVLGHSDVDGLASIAILTRALTAQGYNVTAEVTRKGESAWSDTTLKRLASHQPAALIIADLGSRDAPLLPGTPTLLIDHHRPTGVPPGATLITAYGEEPTATSGLIAYWCAEAIGQARDLDWIAAISILADLGDKTGFPEWLESRQRYGFSSLRQATTLLNSPRRAAKGDASPALNLLLRVSDPRALLADESATTLRDAKVEYDNALAAARRVAPKINGPVALITVHTPCQVHPAVAQMWTGRLAKNIVLCANTGYLPGRVNFSARTKLDMNLIEFLEEVRPTDAGDEFGRGHNRATGGSLRAEQWPEFLKRLGFS